MIPIKLPTPRPDRIDQAFDSITGTLICSACKTPITEDWAIEYGDWYSESLAHRVHMHVCPSIGFKFDFNDPRTLIEQREAHRARKEDTEPPHIVDEQYPALFGD